MLVNIALNAAKYAQHAPAQNVLMRCNGPRRDLLDRDRDILLRDWDETRDASVRDRDVEDFVRDETKTRRLVSRPRRLDRDHIPGI